MAAQQWHEPDLLLAALVASGLCPPLGGTDEGCDEMKRQLITQVDWAR